MSETTRPRAYYVSVLESPRPGARYALLAGPFVDHQMALSLVDKARTLALEAFGTQAMNVAFGTCKGPAGLTVAFPNLGRPV